MSANTVCRAAAPPASVGQRRTWGRWHPLAIVLVVSLGLSVAARVDAEPYLAIRTGYPCGQCHVNQTGGGKRTPFGVIYAETHLYMALVRPDGEPRLIDGSLSPTVSIGSDVRVQNLSRLEYENDDGERAPSGNGSAVTTASIYGEIEVVPGAVSFYLDQIVSPSTTNRELFALIRTHDRRFYGKIGRTILPFGLRLIDDDAFIRNRTGYTYSRHDIAAEVGVELGPSIATVNLTDTQLSTRVSLVSRRLQLGGSFGRSTERGDQYALGGFGGASFGRLTVLGEADVIHDAGIDRFAGLLELDVLLSRGFNAKATYEFFDRNRDVSNDRDGQERITLGVEPFVTRHLQARIFYRINRFIPQSLTENQDEIIVEVHGFF